MTSRRLAAAALAAGTLAALVPGTARAQGELTVYVASAAWAQELSLLTREILERLAAHGVKAEKLRFRVKPQSPPSAAAPEEKPKAAPAKPLPAEFRARLDRVGDDELRGAIAGAAELALSRLAHASVPTSKPPAARTPRDAATRSAPPERNSATESGARPRKRVGR